MIILYMLLSAICALGLVHLLEIGWSNRPLHITNQWPKGRAMRFIWAAGGVVLAISQFPLGIMAALAGLPVCLAHLSLVDRDPMAMIGAADVFGQICRTTRDSFRRFMARTRTGPHF